MTTLLARLRSPSLARANASDAAERASILEHLQAICRTRRGSMRTHPDYGLPDISEMVHSFPAAIREIAAALEHTIAMYEPRLTDVRVRHVPSDTLELVVRFEISATMRSSGRPTPVRYETRLEASRDVKVT